MNTLRILIKRADLCQSFLINRLENDHEMNCNEIEIVDTEPSYCKRLISEIIHLKKQPYGLNK